MTGKEKLYFLLNKIEDTRVITPSGQPVLIHPYKDLVSKYSDVELIQIFTKLENDEKVLKVLKTPAARPNSSFFDPYTDPEDEYFYLDILPAFDDYFAKVQQEPEYQEFSGRKPPQTPPDVQGEMSIPETSQEVIYEVKYSTKTREILINNFLLSRPNSFSENDEVFEYLYNNPNKEISVEEIETSLRKELTKKFDKTLENLGFVGKLRTVFFKVSKDKIIFINPATKKDLEELDIKFLKLK
ncbi:MAG: hypothetical protein UR98_C0017G0017 [Parcubacteria group bacterium GW2011_GWA1_36_12]|nr:MAG: hypothetical protein UR98_C0017G0017 [Parcubacteria group bacterium GW2011_GWA1_36_12]